MTTNTLCRFFHLLQDEASNLRRRVLLALRLDPGIAVGMLHDLVRHLFDVALTFSIRVFTANKPLSGEKGIFRIDNGLTLSRYTDQALSIFCKGDDGGRCPCT